MFRQERSYSGFYRVIPLEMDVKADEADASYKNGVLKIEIPLKKKTEKKKKIDIK